MFQTAQWSASVHFLLEIPGAMQPSHTSQTAQCSASTHFSLEIPVTIQSPHTFQYISHCLAIQSPHTSQTAQWSASVHFPLPGNTISAHVSNRAMVRFNTFPIGNLSGNKISAHVSNRAIVRFNTFPTGTPHTDVSIHFSLPGNTISTHTDR